MILASQQRIRDKPAVSPSCAASQQIVDKAIFELKNV
jgi:hypothetical protein